MTAEMKKKRKLERKFISLEEKIKILDRLESGERLTNIAKQLNLNESTVRTIKRNEMKIRTGVPTGSSVSLNKISRIKDTLILKMENSLTLWIEDCNKRNIALNRHMIKEMARKIYMHLKEVERVSSDETHKNDFSASNGWFERFRNRSCLHNLDNQKAGASANIEIALKFREEFPKIVENGVYTVDQVFSVAETNLFWKKVPQHSYVSENDACPTGFDDKIVLLLCSNASGDYIMRPMLINKYFNESKTREFYDSKHPIYWRVNEEAQATGVLFQDWFFNCFVPEIENYCTRKNISFNVLLVIADTLRRRANFNHPNVRIVSLPFNMEFILHPPLQGVIKMFKCFYTRHRFELILEKMNRSTSQTLRKLWEVFSTEDCIEIISLSLKELNSGILNASWESIWPEVVLTDDCSSVTTEEISRIINISQSLARDEFGKMNEDDIYDLIKNEQECDDIEILQLFDVSLSNITNNDRQTPEDTLNEMNFTLQSLNNGLELAKTLETYFVEKDPLPERSTEFKRKLQECLLPYLKIQKELQMKNL